MASPALAASPFSAAPVRRFFRTPKGLLILVLVLLASLATYGEGVALAVPGLAAAVGAAILVDLPILRWRKHRWIFPDGALLTGLIVAMVLSPHEPWRIAAVTSVIAVLGKYLLRWGLGNVFNPAAVALVATFYLFDTGQSWWGALPELAPLAVIVLIVAGIYVTIKINKLPAALAFLGTYYLLATLAALVGDPARVAELYRAPDLHAALFFAFFMVDDPPTSPARHRDQLVFGAIVGITSLAAFELLGAACYLLIGLLAGNIWESWHRARARRLKAIARNA